MKKLMYFLKVSNIYILIITSTISLTLNLTVFYKYEIDRLNLVNSTKLSKESLYKNYKYLIYYLNSSKSTKLSIPDFKNSYNGEYHFQEVRSLVHINYALNTASLISFLAFILYSIKKNIKINFKIPLILFIVLPFILLIIFFIDFNWFFNAFHKLLFNNNYWIFKKSKDPVINILPEKFFMDIFTLALIIYEIICLAFFYIFKCFNKIISFKE